MYINKLFFEAQGGHIEDGGVVYTRLRDQDLGVFNEILERYGISEWTPAG